MTIFAQMDSEQLVAYLEEHKSSSAVIAQNHHGPRVALHSVGLSKLPPLTAHVVREIDYSRGKVIDLGVGDWARAELILKKLIADDPKLPVGIEFHNSLKQPSLEERTSAHMVRGLHIQAGLPVYEDPEKFSLNPDTPGSMRSYHQNDTKALPTNIFNPSTLTGKAKLYHTYVEHFKGLQNRQKIKGHKQVYTGYIEYTCGGWRDGSTQGRVVYDYVTDRFFFTPDHYTTWYVLDLYA